MAETRREFLGHVGRAALAVAAAPNLAAARGQTRIQQDTVDRAVDPLARVFLSPPHAAKPMTRWWWFGGAVTPQEITRELVFMRDAGLRGAEIQPVYPVTTDDPARGIRNHRFFTPEWYALLRHASGEAKRLGLQLDLTLGSGWPYGGPFVPPALSARRLLMHSRETLGPSRFSWDVSPLVGEDDRVAALVMAPVKDDGSAEIEQSRVLDAAGAGRADLDIPPGRWRVMLFVDAPTGMQVTRATLGMEGPVIDHHDRDAMALFLRAAGDRVFEAIGAEGGPPFDSVFCDSLEVFGADWTGRLLSEFEERRGYALQPHLPALFGDAGPLARHVRYDYHLTLSDLIVEGFFARLAAWSKRRGVRARVQAHGGMGDVMRGYGLADVPEGENIFLGDRYQVNLKHRRLASSAAHIYAKPVASAETYTWLRTPLFTTTLEMMKAATDSVFLDGINQVVNHGYSYSPPEAGEPGWAFYASTEINHTQTWWRHYPHLARYVQRVSAVLQQGESVNPVLVYLPMADVYAEHGVGGLHLDVEVQARLDPSLLDALRRAGYDFDVVNDHALGELMRVEGGELRAGTGRYGAVIVNAASLMPPECASKIAEFARSGGQVIVVGSPPEEAPGVMQHERRSAAVREAFAGLAASVVPDVPAALARLAEVRPPDFHVEDMGPGRMSASPARETVGFVHRRVGPVDCYFVANISAEPRDLRVQFAAGHRRPQRWDAESGRVGEPPYEYLAAAGGAPVTSVELRLEPFASCFVVFGEETANPVVSATDPRGEWEIARNPSGTEIRGLVPSAGSYALSVPPGRARRIRAGRLPRPLPVVGPWTLALGSGPAVALQRLSAWGEIERGRGFSGWGAYETQVEVPDLGQEVEWFIDLGEVHETAEVMLNGQDLGAAWKGRRRLPCGAALVAGANRLRVEVANLWIDHVLAHPPGDPARHLKGVGPDPELAETVGIRWGTYGELPPEHVPPSGLLGPVMLVPLKRVVVRL